MAKVGTLQDMILRPPPPIGDAPEAHKDTGLPGELALDRDHLLRNAVFAFEVGDPRSRTFTLLRSQVLRRLDRSGARVIAVTSVEPRNGKSFIATNLAAALSQIHPTWLVDLDLRRPCVGERFGISADIGIDDYLVGTDRLSAQRLAGGRLTLAPVRVARPNSAELLASPRTAGLFTRLRAEPGAPVIVIDTPPVLEGDDMIIIASHVDALLLVVEEGRTRQSDLAEALRMLNPTPILGSVLNRTILATASSGYGQYYGV